MITVNVYDLLARAAQIIADGFTEVTLDISEDSPASLNIEAVISELAAASYPDIEDVSSPKSGCFKASMDSVAPYTMTFDELVLTVNAFHNAVENCLTCLNDKEISDDLKQQILSDKERYEAYIQKLEDFLSNYMAKG